MNILFYLSKDNPMPNEARRLVILRSWKSFLMRLWFILLALIASLPYYEWESYFSGSLLLFFFFVGLWYSSYRYRLSRRYVVIDASGFWVAARWGDSFAWPQIEACAYKNEPRQRVLRIFLSPDTQMVPISSDPQGASTLLFLQLKTFLGIKSVSKNYFDIDFEVTQNPEQSLDIAFKACSAWIATEVARKN